MTHRYAIIDPSRKPMALGARQARGNYRDLPGMLIDTAPNLAEARKIVSGNPTTRDWKVWDRIVKAFRAE